MAVWFCKRTTLAFAHSNAPGRKCNFQPQPKLEIPSTLLTFLPMSMSMWRLFAILPLVAWADQSCSESSSEELRVDTQFLQRSLQLQQVPWGHVKVLVPEKGEGCFCLRFTWFLPHDLGEIIYILHYLVTGKRQTIQPPETRLPHCWDWSNMCWLATSNLYRMALLDQI